MAQDLINAYIDRDGIQRDTKFILDELNTVLKHFEKLGNANISISGAKSFKETAEAATRLNSVQDELTASIIEYEKVNKQIITTQTKLNVSQSEAAKQLAATKEQLRLQNAELKNQVREQQAAEGSIEQMRATLIRLNKEYDNLAQGEREASNGQELKKKIAGLSSSLKQLEGETGRFQRNVGNYSGAVKVLEDALQDVKKKLDDIDRAGGANADVIKQLEKEYALLSSVTESAGNGFISMRDEIKKNQLAIEQLTLVLGEESPVVRELIQQNAELRDSYGDLVATQKTLGSDTFAFDAMLQGGQALVGMYSAAEGAAALFGSENEDLQKTMIKLQASLALVEGVQATVNALQAEGALVQGLMAARTAISTAAMKVYTFVTSGATVAAKAFNATLLASGIGVVLLLISTAASAMGAFGDETEEATGSLEDFNAELEYSNELLDENIKSLNFSNRIAIEKLRQRGATEKEINDATIRGLKEQKQAYRELADAQQAQFDALLNSSDPNRSDKQKKLADSILKNRQAALDKEREIELKQEEFKTELAEEGIKKRKDNAKKAADDAKEAAAKELKAQFELIKFAKEREIKYLKEQAENEGNPFEIRGDYMQEALEKEEALIIAQRDFELKNNKLTVSERKLIEEKANAEILDARKALALGLVDLHKQEIDSLEADAAKRKEAFEKQGQERIDSVNRMFEKSLALTEINANQELSVLNESYAAGVISKEQYEEKKAAIERKYLRQSIELQIAQYRSLLQLSNLDAQTREDAYKKIAELERQLTDIKVEETDKRKEKTKEETEELKQAYQSVAKELTGLTFDLFTGGIEREKNATQEQIDKLEEKKQKDIEVATQSITNEQERAAAITTIEARAAAEKERLERRKRQLDEQKARFERARSIVEIIQNTGVAISGYLAEQNYAMAILSGIIGAAQIARIVSQPIPKYKQGRKETDSYEGPAIVGDGGKPEAILRREGTVEITPAKDTLTWVRKGDAILPDASKLAEIQMQFAKNKTDQALNIAWTKPDNSIQVDKLSGDIRHMEKSVTRAIKQIPQTKIQVQSPVKRWLGSNGSWSEYLNGL